MGGGDSLADSAFGVPAVGAVSPLVADSTLAGSGLGTPVTCSLLRDALFKIETNSIGEGFIHEGGEGRRGGEEGRRGRERRGGEERRGAEERKEGAILKRNAIKVVFLNNFHLFLFYFIFISFCS